MDTDSPKFKLRRIRTFISKRFAWPTLLTEDSSGNTESLRFLFRNDKLAILMLHDGFGAIRDLRGLDLSTPDTYVYLSHSWFKTAGDFKRYSSELEAIVGLTGDPWGSRNVFMMCNSTEELSSARPYFDDDRLIYCNNASFLNERCYNILERTTSKEFDAVLNAKAAPWKRHELAAGIEKKVFISYPTSENDSESSLERFHPMELHQQISLDHVVRLLNRSHVGLALSAQEGACYASLEYLLCGLPVVSTPSEGGRAAFYDEGNSLIAQPYVKHVASCVFAMRDRLLRNEIQPHQIRNGALSRMHHFRASFLDSLRPLFYARGLDRNYADFCNSLFVDNNKLERSRNFWPKRVFRG